MKYVLDDLPTILTGRSPHGERGLKCTVGGKANFVPCRSPHGERGLKLDGRRVDRIGDPSLSSRRAWIEIEWHAEYVSWEHVALLTESVD